MNRRRENAQQDNALSLGPCYVENVGGEPLPLFAEFASQRKGCLVQVGLARFRCSLSILSGPGEVSDAAQQREAL